ncbi:TRAP transporter large permease [Oceanisphaera sp.]|uniref:TRAP transporter large permease n=1 Tax=Oceanisphaera sp. TaxID=1929979 RepID=UPI003A94676B
MSLTIVALMGIAILFLLILLKVSVSFSMFAVGFFGVWYLTSLTAASNVVSSGIWEQLSSYSLSVIPLFIFMGELLFRSGVTEKLFSASYSWIGHYRGSIATTSILSCAGFGAVSGSNTATAATVGRIALPEMKRFSYHKSLSSGCVATGGTLGIIIPPSTVLIVIALQTEIAVRDLFIASVVPGLILVTLFIATIALLCKVNPAMAPVGERSSWKTRFQSLKDLVEIISLFLFFLGGLFAGWFTSTEAAAVGCAGALIIVTVRGKLSWLMLKESLSSSLRSTAMILMLITGAVIFGRFLTLTRLPYLVGEWAASLPLPGVMIIALILVIYIIGGALMDAMGFLIISLPIFFPVAIALGYDPVWFGILVCIVTSLGAITPPVGINAFIVKNLDPDLSFRDVFKGVGYFVIPYLLCISILIMLPDIVIMFL